MSTVTKIGLQAQLWRNGTDGEPQEHLLLPDDTKAWVRIPQVVGEG